MSVHNKETPFYFEKAIRSIWEKQTLKPNKVVIVEDGQLNEGLSSILTKYKKLLGDILVTIKNEKSIGLTKSLNIGLTHCKTDYIARMDSDDISLAERFETQVAYLIQNPDVAVVGSYAKNIDDNGAVISLRNAPILHEEILKKLPFFNPIIHPSVMINKAVFNSIQEYPNIADTSQDYALWFLVASKGFRFGNIDKALIQYRVIHKAKKRNRYLYAWNELKSRVFGYKITNQPLLKYFFIPILYFVALIPYQNLKKIKSLFLRLK
jgi:glycosyltransferase involved in cell wall biosynthesis